MKKLLSLLLTLILLCSTLVTGAAQAAAAKFLLLTLIVLYIVVFAKYTSDFVSITWFVFLLEVQKVGIKGYTWLQIFRFIHDLRVCRWAKRRDC